MAIFDVQKEILGICKDELDETLYWDFYENMAEVLKLSEGVGNWEEMLREIRTFSETDNSSVIEEDFNYHMMVNETKMKSWTCLDCFEKDDDGNLIKDADGNNIRTQFLSPDNMVVDENDEYVHGIICPKCTSINVEIEGLDADAKGREDDCRENWKNVKDKNFETTVVRESQYPDSYKHWEKGFDKITTDKTDLEVLCGGAVMPMKKYKGFDEVGLPCIKKAPNWLVMPVTGTPYDFFGSQAPKSIFLNKDAFRRIRDALKVGTDILNYRFYTLGESVDREVKVWAKPIKVGEKNSFKLESKKFPIAKKQWVKAIVSSDILDDDDWDFMRTHMMAAIGKGNIIQKCKGRRWKDCLDMIEEGHIPGLTRKEADTLAGQMRFSDLDITKKHVGFAMVVYPKGDIFTKKEELIIRMNWSGKEYMRKFIHIKKY